MSKIIHTQMQFLIFATTPSSIQVCTFYRPPIQAKYLIYDSLQWNKFYHIDISSDGPLLNFCCWQLKIWFIESSGVVKIEKCLDVLCDRGISIKLKGNFTAIKLTMLYGKECLGN